MIRDLDTVISSRIRFARNLKDYPYTSRLDENGAKEIIDRVSKALGNEYEARNFEKLSHNERMSLVEKHDVSLDFVRSVLPRELFVKDDTKIMVCEEDHIRLQVIKNGSSLEECYNEAVCTDKLLNEKLNIDYNDTLGYLTHCPTNLGTAMRASVMMFLPGISITAKLKSIALQLDKLGLTIRGMYGEGSEPGAYIYQISNRETLGISEEKVISKINDIVTQITEIERKTRDELKKRNGISLEDKISRAEGTLKYAKMISSKEFSELYALIRMGGDHDISRLDSLFCEVMPYSLCVNYNKSLNESERDIYRAEYIQKAFG
ncbi:MAG: ATP--guanido phosphotransferase [Ruminococcaceae bacterium]|nr:ATP--guanido phosphotransferase [Oscillospiraceae bacterium]